MLSARERTDRITRAAIGYYVKKRFACYREIGIMRRGRRRCDVLAMAMNRFLVAIEVKQSWTDFVLDIRSGKHLDYLEVCNQFYFCLPHDLGDARIEQARTMVPAAAGIMVLEPDGLVAVFKPAQVREITQDTIRYIVTKLAWRGGISRHNSRRTRVYL